MSEPNPRATAKHRACRRALDSFRGFFGPVPVPLAIAKRMRSATLYEEEVLSSLYPRLEMITSDGSQVRNPELGRMLSGTEIGWWSLMAESIDYIERHLARERPRRVLEFGSGISTLTLAVFMRKLFPNAEGPLVYSIEQGEDELQKTAQLLEQHGLADTVRLLHCPMTACTVLGHETECYDLAADHLQEAFGETRFEFVLVDGPFGPPGCRVATLPRVLDYAEPGATFLMDDALRDAEIDIVAAGWARSPAIKVKGLMFLGKGFLKGRIAKGT